MLPTAIPPTAPPLNELPPPEVVFIALVLGFGCAKVALVGLELEVETVIGVVDVAGVVVWLGLAVCDDEDLAASAVVVARAALQYAVYIETAVLMSAMLPLQMLFAHDVKKLDTVTDKSARHTHAL